MCGSNKSNYQQAASCENRQFDESTYCGAQKYISWGTKVYIVSHESMTFPDLTRHFFVILAE